MRPAIVSGMVTGDVPVSYWPIFFPVPSNSPRSLCAKKLTRPSFPLSSNVANYIYSSDQSETLNTSHYKFSCYSFALFSNGHMFCL